MNKVHLLGANRSYDRDVQTVSVNQVVVLEGYSYDSYVVYEVTRDKWGITYHLVNLRTHEFHTSDLIRPLSEKFGIGIYYDDANPRFLDPLETAALLTKAKEKKAEEEKKAKEVREEYERIAKIGTERLRPLVPTDAKAVIIGTLRVNECDSYTDYYDYSIARTVILGFSKHTPILRERPIWWNITQITNTVKITAWGTACIWAGTSTAVGRLRKSLSTTLKSS